MPKVRIVEISQSPIFRVIARFRIHFYYKTKLKNPFHNPWEKTSLPELPYLNAAYSHQFPPINITVNYTWPIFDCILRSFSFKSFWRWILSFFPLSARRDKDWRLRSFLVLWILLSRVWSSRFSNCIVGDFSAFSSPSLSVSIWSGWCSWVLGVCRYICRENWHLDSPNLWLHLSEEGFKFWFSFSVTLPLPPISFSFVADWNRRPGNKRFPVSPRKQFPGSSVMPRVSKSCRDPEGSIAFSFGH